MTQLTWDQKKKMVRDNLRTDDRILGALDIKTDNWEDDKKTLEKMEITVIQQSVVDNCEVHTTIKTVIDGLERIVTLDERFMR